MAKESGWVTINGVHVFIDNSGKISKGPAKFIGSSLSDLPSSGGKQSQADLKSRLQAKQAAKEPKYDFEEEKRKIEARKNPGRTQGSINKTESTPEKPKRMTAKSLGYGKEALRKMTPEQLRAELEKVDTLENNMKDGRAWLISVGALTQELNDRGYRPSLDNKTISFDEKLLKGGGSASKAKSTPKRTPEKREATATDVLGVNGSDPTGVATLKDMRSELMIKAINNDGKLSKADQKKLDLIEQELNNSPWKESRSSTRTRGSSSSSSSLSPSEKLAMESKIGFDTDFSKMTKKEIEAGISKLEKAMRMTDDVYEIDGYDMSIFDAQNALDSGNYKRSASTTRATTGNSTFDNATKSNKKTTTGSGTRGKASQSKPVDLEVAHYDGWGFGGSRNVYTAIYPDGTRKNISATQAKEFFPDSPATQHIRPRGKKK